MSEFILPVRVYYEDTDCGGVVYHTNYLKFMERARAEWLRSLGIEQDRLAIDFRIIFTVMSARITFLKPVKFNQLLQVSATVEKVGSASIMFYQKIDTELSGVNTLMCESWIKVACVSADSLKPQRLPESIKREIMGGC